MDDTADVGATSIDWEDRFHSTMESLRDPLLIMSSIRGESGDVVDFRYEYVNRPALTNIGLPESELIGSTLLTLFPSHTELGLFESYRRVVMTGDPLVLEVPWFDEGNVVGAWEVSANKLGDGFVAITRDVSDRVLATKRLTDRERHYRLLADHAAEVAVMAIDEVIQWISPSVTTLLGFTPEEMVGRSTAEFVHPEDWADVADQRDSLQARGLSRDRYRVLRRDGTWRWVEGIARVAHDEDRAGTVVSVLWDVHTEVEALEALERAEADRRDLEARVQQAERLESLGVLAGGIAHDFNNMLAGVLGNAELALAVLGPDSPAARLVEQIMVGAERAAELTRQMLAYAGKRGLDLRPVRLGDVVDDTLQLVNAVISKSASVNLDVPASLPPVFGDPGQLRQVFMNLVINASDSLEGRTGQITVRAASRDVDAEMSARLSPDAPLAPGTFVELEVADDGCGMSADTARRALEPFFTTKSTGRGLGLSVVHGVARSMGGAVQIDSAPGAGTSIRILLPATEPAPEPTDAPRPRLSRSDARRSILVVDDDRALLATVREALEVAGHDVVVARDGEVAIEIFRSMPDRIAAAIVDLTLPGISGHQVIALMRLESPDLRVVLMSGYDATDANDHPDRSSDVTFIQKPFRLKSLLDAVQ